MGGGKMPDFRQLVPRTPPEGMREWVLKTQAKALERFGLVYEAEYVEDWGFEAMLDEHAKPRKTKVVRVTCSCCGESTLLNWSHTQAHGYGFILPEDEEGDWGETVTEAGDECRCPMCNALVLVNKRSAVKDYYVTAETTCMSAGLIGEDSLLALTGWAVQQVTYKSGSYGLKIIPAEAYVFTAGGCAKLMGWRNGYSGQCGYFIQYARQWRQPVLWRESWGQEEQIFGLTGALIERSCLPHCKLDAYMAPRVGARHFPVPYLRLYQAHPNVEAVLLHGLPRVLDGLIVQRVNSRTWEENRAGLMSIPSVDWAQTRPAQMLRLTKEELRVARERCWELWHWELFTAAKKLGQPMTGEDIENAHCLGDEHIDALLPYGHIARDIRYLLHQCEELAAEVDEEEADPIPDAQLLLDYWDMSRRLNRNLEDASVRYPRDLIAAHDSAAELVKQKELDDMANLFRIRRRVLKKYIFAADGLLIRPAASQRELTAEGDALHHCVSTYGKRHATGATAIFFIRRAAEPRAPYFTLELDEKELTVRQNRGLRNCARTQQVQEFEEKWLAWLRGGCQRDKTGRPILPEKRKEEAA